MLGSSLWWEIHLPKTQKTRVFRPAQVLPMGNLPGQPEQTQTVPGRAIRARELVFVPITSLLPLSSKSTLCPALQSWRLNHVSISPGALLDLISRGRCDALVFSSYKAATGSRQEAQQCSLCYSNQLIFIHKWMKCSHACSNKVWSSAWGGQGVGVGCSPLEGLISTIDKKVLIHR